VCTEWIIGNHNRNGYAELPLDTHPESVGHCRPIMATEVFDAESTTRIITEIEDPPTAHSRIANRGEFAVRFP